ncbi:alcohol dehydrogenase catalytic domain-containing protein [Roseomonas eburnea]|uniref:Alcohol dehydrogenase catalytic domain-containing protein n=1 Tax=Neoroseomonas eburnea TaxID=1346889 RepID=A0A9X9XBJ7_9PROT|nr:alcohol dehydrogenase catalytic domain-containing protein [Neoroseomonas eburnea]MBR0681083.1 alcohol dehydrogenase catalytic domain-containing protein [Neoroseomonas eburnea]
MLALCKTRAGFGLEALDLPAPASPGPGEALIEVEAVGICGSDVHAYEWTDGYGHMVPYLPVIMGHEFAGRVAAVGDGARIAEGTRVAVHPAVFLGDGKAAWPGDPRIGAERRVLGLTAQGGFARFVKVPASNLLPLPAAVDAELGALVEPLSVAAEAVLVGDVGLGDTVLVLGPGTIGQGLALMARAAGAGRVIVAGRADAPRFEVLRSLGVTDTIDVAEGPLADQVLALTGGRPVDVVLEATGHPPSITDALPVLKRGGVLVVAGIHAAPLSLPLTTFVRNRHQLRASHGSEHATWERVIALLARDPEAFRPMITHRLPLERGLEGFELARQRAASKVILTP